MRLEEALKFLEGLVGGVLLESEAVAGIKVLPDTGFAGGSERNKNGAHGFGGGAAARTGDAGDSEGVIGFGGTPRAFRHFAGDGFADGAVLFEGFCAHAEEGLLGFVAVSDEASGKNCRGTRHVCDAVGEQAAGAGFRERERFFSRREQADDRVFQEVSHGEGEGPLITVGEEEDQMAGE